MSRKCISNAVLSRKRAGRRASRRTFSVQSFEIEALKNSRAFGHNADTFLNLANFSLSVIG